MRAHRLCALVEIGPDAARGFTLGEGAGQREVFIVRRGDDVYAYLNRCPHRGLNLDWVPDQFLSRDHAYIQCATHGALFRIEDGYCIAGPCAGARLEALPLILTETEIWVRDISDGRRA